MSECKCGRASRDDHYFCDECGDRLARALGECPWLDTELDTTLTGRKGIDYRRLGGSPSSEPRLPMHAGAAEARTHLRDILVAWTLFCRNENIRHQSPRHGLPASTIPAMSRWLLWRVDGLALHDIGPEAVDEITQAVARGRRVIDRPADRWFAGPCDVTECRADLYARSQAGTMACAACGAGYDVAARRGWLLEAAEDHLAPATELARAVSWLGASPLTPERVRQWASRGRLLPHGHDGRSPLYRVGDAIDLLAEHSAKVKP